MPPAVTTGSLLTKYNTMDAMVAKHAGDDTNYGIIQLPPGINNGVAKLTTGCKFGTFQTGKNQGETFARFEATVVRPLTVMTKDGEVKVQGQYTSLMFPLCQTENQAGKVTTQEENVARFMNELRKLGVDTSGFKSRKDLEAAMAALGQVRPYVRFSTSASAVTPANPDPRVWENWHGIIEDYEPPADDDTEDGSGEVSPNPPSPAPSVLARPKANGSPAPAATPPKAATTPPKAAPATKPAPAKKAAPPPAEAFDEFGDVDSLIEQAKADDAEAQNKVIEMCVAKGMDQDAAESEPSWDVLSAYLKGEGEAPEAAEETGEDGGWLPNVGDVFDYTPTDPKTKRPGKKVEVEIVEVDPKARTAKVKNLTTQKVYPAPVPLDGGGLG